MNSTISAKLVDANVDSLEFDVLGFNHRLSLNIISDTPAKDPLVLSDIYSARDFTITRFAEKPAPILYPFYKKGQLFDEVIVTVSFGSMRARAGNQQRLAYILKQCLLTSISIEIEGEHPIETIAFNFADIQWNYVN